MPRRWPRIHVIAIGLILVGGCFPTFAFLPNDAPDAGPAAAGAGDAAVADAPTSDERDSSGPADAPFEGDARDASTGLTLDPGFPLTANFDSTTGPSIATPLITTSGPDRLMVAVVIWGTTTNSQEPVSVNGGGVTWTRQVTGQFPDGGAPPGTSGNAIWTAWAATPIAGQAVTATRSTGQPAALTIAVYSFAGASKILGAVSGYGNQAGNSQLISTIDASTAGSWIVGGFHAGTANQNIVPQPNTVWDITDNSANAPAGHFNAAGRLVGTVAAPQRITVGAAYVGPYIVTTTVEVLPAP